ncbi:MAG: hypothetical protein IKJ45_14040 [Kiritimatiellae bacterium]|nr:hypothetical protein [Kiritimatiellia bacterium]
MSSGSIKGWQTYPKSGSAVKINRGDYLLRKGEGLIIAYKKTVNCLLQVSGEVELADTSCTITAAASSSSTSWSFGGNFTPNTVDVLSITPKKADGSDWASSGVGNNVIGSGQLILQKIASNGAYTDRIQYMSSGSIKGWQTYPKSGTGHALVADEMTFAPGEGFIVAYKKTVPCKLLFPSPISASEEP